MNRIEKDWKDLPADEVDFNTRGDLQWNWGRGGHPLDDREWSISSLTKDLVETRYKLPKCLNEMLEAQYKYGKHDARRAMQQALGI